MLWANLLNFLPNLLRGAVEIHKTNKTIKAAKDERKAVLKEMALITKLEQIKNADATNMQLDLDADNRIPWANDISFMLALIPVCLSFYPPALPAMTAGFVQLEALPQWYKYMLGMMLVSVWGYRTLVGPIIKARLGVKQS